MNLLREKIEKKIADNDWTDLKGMILEFSEKYPNDLNGMLFRIHLHLNQGEIEEAYQEAQRGVQEYPLCPDTHEMLGYLCHHRDDWFNALYYLNRANLLYKAVMDLDCPQIDEEISEILSEIDEYSKSIDSLEEFGALNERINAHMCIQNRDFDLSNMNYRMMQPCVGTLFYENYHNPPKYVGAYKDQYYVRYQVKNAFNLIAMKGEYIPVTQGTQFRIEENEPAGEYLLPIASDENDAIYTILQEGEQAKECHHSFGKQFNYYRLKNKTQISTSVNSFFGRPIPLNHNKNRKKLVLNIFVDGLSGMSLQGDLFKKYMPYTFQRFERGIIFDEAYTTGEWTYPCLATIVSGLDTTHHMMIHGKLENRIPDSVTTIAEAFHEAGYSTSQLGGNWRIVPSYGHARGYDRFIYQHQKAGFKVQEIISEAINDIETFKETDHFLWISIGDLHDVADKDELPTAVQRSVDISDREYEHESAEMTSAKRRYSEKKTNMYLEDMKYIDLWLHILFQYIEENFDEKEVVISLFADHGQGYLVRNDQHFLSKGKSKVAFMFAGGEVPSLGRVRELVSICDYGHIMRELCHLEHPIQAMDGRLPVSLGGEAERSYVITDSIHPGDPYQAALRMKQCTFFLKNHATVMYDGRFDWSEYDCWLEDDEESVIEDEELTKECLSVVMNHIDKLIIH